MSTHEEKLMNLSNSCLDSDDICQPTQHIYMLKMSRSLPSTLPSLMCFKTISAGLIGLSSNSQIVGFSA